MDASLKSKILENYHQILEILNTYDHSPTLVAVSKGQPIEKIQLLYEAGHRDFGENYAQELTAKANSLQHLDQIRWHFIGPIQSNKVKSIANLLFAWHTLDRIKTAQLFSAHRLNHLNQLNCFIQVNIDNEEGKHGVPPENSLSLCKNISPLPNLNLLGLMCIPSQNHPELAFPKLNDLEKLCRPHTKGRLSMGMSSDYRQALENGSTHVRIGTQLFGNRNSP